jgi:D-lyxose ketol-isomerase
MNGGYFLKRSQINASIRNLEAVAGKLGFILPPFCRWTPEEWREKGAEYDEIRDNMLGWDITDYGEGDFLKVGLSLVTLRNGNVKKPKYRKTYAEKLLLLLEGQYSPLHFHYNKMEDIINRGGGNVLIRVYNADGDSLSDRPVRIYSDGRDYEVPAGTQICLAPGESITIYPYLYHDFQVETGTGTVLLGEVSMCNDDMADNHFYKQLNRFPAIEEDEAPYRLLVSEYPPARMPRAPQSADL